MYLREFILVKEKVGYILRMLVYVIEGFKILMLKIGYYRFFYLLNLFYKI